MATFYTCMRCNNGGVRICTGCNGHFCQRDFLIHRQILAKEFENIKSQGNQLIEQITKSNQSNKVQQSLVSEIQKWHDTTVDKTRRAAIKVRDEVNTMIQQNIVNIKKGLTELDQELIESFSSDRIMEENIEQLREKIRRLRSDFEKSSDLASIVVNVEPSTRIDWNHVIHVEDKSSGRKVTLH
ncbi:unnamed protein product [Rotaria magnacalcarata]|uniref:B box-type domain-containing protein n=1 Tax=Rotaria magnacalcarata TaxID=392030 RepID=A0A8S3HDZ6_9BILA|nr:unnamed protein product [Rotaria magnacalcarata]